MIHAWVEKGLLFCVRTEEGERPSHAIFLDNDMVVWIPNGDDGSVLPLLDIEKHQINHGLPWPPPEAAVSM